MKSVIVLFLLICALGAVTYVRNVAKFNYEGADEPGHSYPPTVQDRFIEQCERSFTRGRDSFSQGKKRISDSEILRLCDCCLERMEDTISYKQYDEISSKVALGFKTGMPARFPGKLRHLFNACANDLGYEISGAFF